MSLLIISKLIDGVYPNYESVIPNQCEERVCVDREILQNAVRRVSLMLNDQSSSVQMDITENRVELSTRSPEIGDANELSLIHI